MAGNHKPQKMNKNKYWYYGTVAERNRRVTSYTSHEPGHGLFARLLGEHAVAPLVNEFKRLPQDRVEGLVHPPLRRAVRAQLQHQPHNPVTSTIQPRNPANTTSPPHHQPTSSEPQRPQKRRRRASLSQAERSLVNRNARIVNHSAYYLHGNARI
eukprot:952537-Prorocentrum_minimum.AAC.1